jgi:N-methylhydantoinase B
MTSAFASIAEEMGTVLVRSAYSANIKERRDCSAALFDSDGRMIAQAAHIPVHLGAMPEAVEAVIARDPQSGEVYMLNHPFSGGTHLPDITLVSPVEVGGAIVAYAVTRAHHADVGGMRPGSMPSDSTELFQEGLIIPPVRVASNGEFIDDVLSMVLANVRTPHERRGDLRAQLAAHRIADERIAELVDRRGIAVVRAAFEAVVSYSERRARQTIAQLPDGVYRAKSEIEGDGTDDIDIPLEVAVTIEGDGIIVDFAGTADAVTGNINCPLAVTRSACYFAVNVLLPRDIPANAGTYAPIEVRAPTGCLVNAQHPSAVVAGNVETSQRIADTVMVALAQATEMPAQGQGTMNVLVIGGTDWTYVETLGGGQGASRSGPGSSGVHVGMSNTLNTPVEALEGELPLRIARYELRYGSGGKGQNAGGDGLIREIHMLAPARLSLFSDRRRHRPQGGCGGEPGATGRNRLNDRELPPKAAAELKPGDTVIVETPGGGGWGSPDSDSSASSAML